MLNSNSRNSRRGSERVEFRIIQDTLIPQTLKAQGDLHTLHTTHGFTWRGPPRQSRRSRRVGVPAHELLAITRTPELRTQMQRLMTIGIPTQACPRAHAGMRLRTPRVMIWPYTDGPVPLGPRAAPRLGGGRADTLGEHTARNRSQPWNSIEFHRIPRRGSFRVNSV